MKKTFSFVLALAMVFAISTAALAASPAVGSITITNPTKDATYNVYRILDLYASADYSAITYKANAAWKTFVESNEIKGAYLNTDAQGYVTWVEDADVKAFAAAAITYAKDSQNSITATATKTASNTDPLTINNLELGYYLVDSSLGALCALDTTTPNANVTEKNEAPTVTKEVKEDSTGAWGENNDADINQVVEFKATVSNVDYRLETLTLRDKMSEGLTFDPDSVKVYLNTEDNPVDAANYELVTENTDGYTFKVNFKPAFLATINEKSTIIVTYSATLNENAVVGQPGNPNEVDITYGDNNSFQSEIDKTVTYTWKVDVFKFHKAGEAGTIEALAGAKFVLKNEEDKFATWTAGTDGDYQFKAWAESADESSILVSPANGYIHMTGLDSGTYTLTETEAPAGYNKLASDITIKINNDGTVEGGQKDPAAETPGVGIVIPVENKTGAEMPSTGALGTAIFTAVGAILMIGTAMIIVARKKVASEI